jgi:hypothetical protein
MTSHFRRISAALAGFALMTAIATADSARAADAVAPRYMGDGGVMRLPANDNSTQVWHLAAMRKYQLDKKHGFTLQIVPAATSQMTANAIQSGQAEIGSSSTSRGCARPDSS